MSLPQKPEQAKQSVSNRKKEVLAEARASALRANLKKRKDQTLGRKQEEIEKDE
jgi:hypothetical protein